MHFALSFLAGSLLLWSCANQGAPEGGPYDMEPPRLLQANPEVKATGVTTRHFVLTFDENVKLSSQTDKIIVSPPQREAARITASGRHVNIQLEDTLRPSTTYSFYFDDVIVDNNEDNPLEGFSYLISTGERIDSMQVVGRIVDALTYEPIGGLIVGAYPSAILQDSTLQKVAFPYVSKTNKMGYFTMRGLPDSTYRIFATKDNDANYKYSDRSEGLAFSRRDYKTSLLDSMRTDTIRIDSIVRRDTLYRDSLVTHPHTYYFPQDVALRYSVAQLQQVGMERYSRLDSLVCRVEFLTEVKALPRLRSLDKPSSAEDRLYWATAKGRSVDFWLRDPDLISRDSVHFTLTYPKTDSLFVVREQTDTLLFVKPPTRTKKGAKEATPERSPLQLTLAGAKGLASGTPGDSLYLVASRPLETFPSSALRLEVREDSTYKPQLFTLEVDSLDRLRYTLRFDRAYGRSYRATLDSAALRDIYGAVSDSTAYTQQIQKEEELGHLSVTLQGIRSDALVQLLDKSDAVLLQARATEVKSDSTQSSPASSTAEGDKVLKDLLAQQSGRVATKDSLLVDSLQGKSQPLESCRVSFRDLKPGDYYLRLIVDSDHNDEFTPGDYPTRDPEEVYYCPQTFAVKKGFTSEEKWDIHAVSPFSAKPEALRKTKPDEAKKKREDKNAEYYKRWGRKR